MYLRCRLIKGLGIFKEPYSDTHFFTCKRCLGVHVQYINTVQILYVLQTMEVQPVDINCPPGQGHSTACCTVQYILSNGRTFRSGLHVYTQYVKLYNGGSLCFHVCTEQMFISLATSPSLICKSPLFYYHKCFDFY